MADASDSPKLRYADLESVRRRLDLRQRSTSRIAGPFLPLFMARLTARFLPLRLIEGIEPAILSLASRTNLFADYFDDLLEALMDRGQETRDLSPSSGDTFAAQAYAASGPGNTASGRSGTSLIVVLPGADWRYGLRDGFRAEDRFWLCLGRVRVPPPAGSGRIVDTAQFRKLSDLSVGEDIRGEAARYIRFLIGRLPELADLLTNNGVGLENELTTEISRMVLQATEIASAYALVAPSHVTVLTGDHEAGAAVAALYEAGCPEENISIEAASPRLSCRLRQQGRAAPGEADGVIGLLDTYHRQALHPRLSGGIVVLAGSNGRHLPKAISAMKAFCYHTHVDFLVPTSSFKKETFRALWQLFIWRPSRFRFQHVRSHYFFRPLRGDHPAPSGLIASGSPGGPVSPAVGAAARLGAVIFCDHFLLPFLATAGALEASFRKWRPKALVLIPGTTPFAQIAAGAARRAGVPSWQVQTLLTQPDGREYRPVADYIGVIDTFQASLFEDYFDADPKRIHCVGYLALNPSGAERWRDQNISDPVDMIFVSQPIPNLANGCAALIAEALASQPGLRCHIYSHPVETDQQVAALMRIAARVPRNRMTWMGRGIGDHVLVSARAIICMYSNIGIQAAMMGRDVIVAAPDGVEYPVRFDEMGIALMADTPSRLIEMLSDLFSEGPLSRDLTAKRHEYFAANPRLQDKNNADSFVRLVLESL